MIESLTSKSMNCPWPHKREKGSATVYTPTATMDVTTLRAPEVGCSKEVFPRSKARLSIKDMFQRIGGTTSYATASSHQIKTRPFSIIRRKKILTLPRQELRPNGPLI